jgi:hypothetical protein
MTTAWPLVALWTRPTLLLIVTSLALTLIIHPIIAVVGYLLGARRSAR